MKSIKNRVLVSVNYIVEVENDDMWGKKNGEQFKKISEPFEERFPEEIQLTESISIQRESLKYTNLDYPNANRMECPVCKRLITDPSKPNPIRVLREAKELEGVMLCESCSYDIKWDMKSTGKNIKSVLAKYQ